MLGRFERFSFALSTLYRYWHKIVSEEMERLGLKGPCAIYLAALYHHPDGLTAAELCQLCGKDKSDASRVLSLMEQKQLLIKEGANQYRALLKLTPEGYRAAGQMMERARIAVDLGGTFRQFWFTVWCAVCAGKLGCGRMGDTGGDEGMR